MGIPTKLITYEDSLTMPENRFEEILHGESRIMPPPTSAHVFLIEELAEILRPQLDRAQYKVLEAGAGLGIERVPLTYRIPDLMVFRQDVLRQEWARKSPADPYIWAVPELIVECLSPANRKGDVQELLDNYAQIAVPEVWLLNPKTPRFTSYRYESGAMHEFQTAGTGVVHPLLLPKVSVDLASLWSAFQNGPLG